ncbi:hypothetical protein TrCOL_g9568 [Triparma columacea]|uniref:Uncharacterized protein n=1 Tax=Triparma columacea TaxID=722753 RepID=A0A9W7LDA4_9STRA|nr:hypothetical protein TrCOL_g9568 [Triparma columacea]
MLGTSSIDSSQTSASDLDDVPPLTSTNDPSGSPLSWSVASSLAEGSLQGVNHHHKTDDQAGKERFEIQTQSMDKTESDTSAAPTAPNAPTAPTAPAPNVQAIVPSEVKLLYPNDTILADMCDRLAVLRLAVTLKEAI